MEEIKKHKDDKIWYYAEGNLTFENRKQVKEYFGVSKFRRLYKEKRISLVWKF